ncbi:MAG: hypothetical protein HC841_09075 [Verrucomicrobiae bacterium]|nr:hypothetical protein [Verrucomicrobiae bacterium]
MRPLKGVPSSKASSSKRQANRPMQPFGDRGADDRKRSGPRSRSEGKVSYRLMDEHLPTRGQRMWRGIARLFKRPTGPNVPPGVERRDPAAGSHADGQPSADLQSFLDARRRDLERRKRGPEDTLH